MTQNPPTTRFAQLADHVKEWPTQPGVYLMRDGSGRILYVGKAKNLRNRIKSYFQNLDKNTPKTRVLMRKVQEVEFTVTNTELEALLLECNLIKKHRPRYNVRLKDDKNFPYVVLDFTHPFPQFRITRKVRLDPMLKYFGPFSAGVNDLGRFLLKTFQIRDCSDAKFKNRTRPCLNYEIGTCTAPCVALVTQEDYSHQLQEAGLFLRGKTQELLAELTKEMEDASEKMAFEQAKTLRDRIYAIHKIIQKQHTVMTDEQKDVDVVGRHRQGNDIQWVILFIRSGQLTGRKGVKVSSPVESEDGAMVSFLEQYYTSALVPDEVWVAGDFEGRGDFERLLREKTEKAFRVRVRRGEKPMRLLGMAQENARLLYQDSEKKTPTSGSKELAAALGLPEVPHTIEGIDVSNFQGKEPSVALVHFADERPLKSRYRTYHPKTVEGQNDFGMIYEVVKRRFTNKENPPPDLLMIDGGKGQLSSAVKALAEIGVEVPVCSLAKARTESSFTRKEVARSQERVFIPNRKNPINLKEGSAGLNLLQQVRDEAHRFSVKGHRSRRKKATEKSPLTDLPGVGPKTKQKLLEKFGTLKAMEAAGPEGLEAAGIPKKKAQEIHQFLVKSLTKD